MKKRYTLWTNDVETTSIWLNNLNDETGFRVYREGMPILLDLYEEFNIKSTFFFTGYIAKMIPDIVRMILSNGHEVASHGKSHLKENGFDVMPFERQKRHLLESKKLLEDISGQEVISFRAPALRVNQHTTRALIESGYKIDSSVASQRFDFFMSFGGYNKLKWISSPRKPYKTDSNNIFKKGNGPLVEVPLSAFVFPYLGTTMRIFPKTTSIHRSLMTHESNLTGKPIVFDIHPNEFIDESHLDRNINRRSSNPVSYLLQDYLRSKLKVKNLGRDAIPIFKEQLLHFKKNSYVSCTIRNYCEREGLI